MQKQNNKFNNLKIWLFNHQIFLILMITVLLTKCDDSINLSHLTVANNNSRVAKHLYLPDENEPEFILPEVVDNRVRMLPAAINAPSVSSLANSRIIKIMSMSCRYDDKDHTYFRASILAPRNFQQPIVDSENIPSDLCAIKKINNEYLVDFTNKLFLNCGIQDCSSEIEKFHCLNIRFPIISGLRLKQDMKILLRCRVQEKITSHTKRINLKTLDTSARMSPRIATGGDKNIFETDIGLYRKALGSDNLFDAKIQPGGTVILGEKILLRVVVRDGDGWKYSKISDVSLHYVENNNRKKNIINSLWILDGNGCLNPSLDKITSRQQYQVSSLETYFIFEAFMFDNMRESDEMTMSVKVTGCLDVNDCIINCSSSDQRVRKSRSLKNNLHNQTVDYLLDDISFRVIYQKQNDDKYITPAIYTIFFIFILIVVITLICTLSVQQRQKKNQRFY